MNVSRTFPVILLALLRGAVAPAPRCKADGFYQAAPLVFDCKGNGDSYPQDSQVPVGIRPRGSWSQTIPKATRNLIVTADAPSDISLDLLDPFTNQAIQAPAYKGVPFESVNAPGLPAHKEVRLVGTAPNDLVLRVTNNAGFPATVQIGYVYGHYTSDVVSKQCRADHPALGCAQFKQVEVRDIAADWSCWLKDKYGTSDAAWEDLAAPVVQSLGVPSYNWCSVWKLWKAAPKGSCMAMFKFFSQGGYELGITGVYRPNFDWASKSCTMRQFLVLCCQKLRSKWGTAQDAWNEWGNSGLQNGQLISSSSKGPWETCGDLRPSGISEQDFFKFLDADGYGGVRVDDIAVCWKTPSKLPASAVKYKPVPATSATYSGQGSSNAASGAPYPQSNGLGDLPRVPSANGPQPSSNPQGQGDLSKFPAAGSPERPINPVSKKQKLSSILTYTAGGLAVAAAAATSIALAVRKSQQDQKGQSMGTYQHGQSPLKVPARSSGSSSLAYQQQVAQPPVAPSNGNLGSGSLNSGSSSGSFQSSNCGSITRLLPDSMRQNPAIVICASVAVVCLCCLLIFVLLFCCRSTRKSRGTEDADSEREFANDDDYDDDDEEVALLTTERQHTQQQLQQQQRWQQQEVRRMDHGQDYGHAEQHPPLAFGIETGQEYHQPITYPQPQQQGYYQQPHPGYQYDYT